MSKRSTSERANGDLLDIYIQGVRLFGRQKALSYIESIEHVFDLLATQPRTGRPANTIAPGIRRHEHGRHVIFYEEAASGVTVLAVVHASAVRRLRL